MAITSNIIPSTFSPSGNPLVFKYTSDNINLSYFKVDVRNDVTIFSSLKIYTTPKERLSATFDISKIISNYVKTQIATTNVIYNTSQIGEYFLVVTEYARNGNSLVAGATSTSQRFYTWNGGVPPIAFRGYDYSQFNSASPTSRFLTNKPTQLTMNYWSTEYLYYLNSGDANNVFYEIFYKNGTSTNLTYPIDSTSKLGRLNLSPRALLNLGYDVANLKYFTVELINQNYVPKSEKVTRIMDYDSCSKPINIHWLNSLGGVDSITVFNPRETRNVSKTVLETGNEDIYKSFEHVLDVKETSTYTVVTDYLNDKNYSWVTELISSRAVFVELSNGYLLPIKINNTSAPIQTSRFSNTPNSFEFQFITVSGLNIPYSETSATKIGFNGTNQIITLPALDVTYTVNNHGLLI